MKRRQIAIFGGLNTARLILVGSGLIAIVIALAILFAPEALYAGYGIEVGDNATLANELKAPGGMLLAAGMLMFAGVFRSQYAVMSLTTAAGVYLSYGFSRLASMAIDGIPHSGLVGAAGLELVIGAVCLITLLHIRHINAQVTLEQETTL